MTRIAGVDGDDPVLGQFLGLLARDIASHPERLQTMDAGLVQRLQSLVGSIEVDLDATNSQPNRRPPAIRREDKNHHGFMSEARSGQELPDSYGEWSKDRR